MIKGIGTAAFTLIVVIFIIYLSYICSKYIGKKGLGMRKNSKYMKVIDQMAVGQDRSLTLIQTGANYYLVGIAGNGITILAELKEEELVELPAEETSNKTFPKDFKSIMEKMEQFKSINK